MGPMEPPRHKFQISDSPTILPWVRTAEQSWSGNFGNAGTLMFFIHEDESNLQI